MIAEIVPARRLPAAISVLSYLVPITLESKIKVGQLVNIPLQKHEDYGVVVKLSSGIATERPLKEVAAIVIERPILNDAQLKFLNELSELYATPLGFLVKSNLPPLKSTKLAKIAEVGALPKNVEMAVKPSIYVYRDNADRLEYFKKFADNKGQTLILCPDVAGAKRLYAALAPLVSETSLVTGDSTEKELFSDWFDIWNGKIKLIVGTRRALFLSYFDLKNVVVDDEGNENYKSWDMAPRYHTRDAAMLLSQCHRASLHLATYTPAVETFFFAKQKVYDTTKGELLPIKARIIDMSGERRSGNQGAISGYLAKKIIDNVDGQTFLFLNRRGTQNYVACKDCLQVSRCPTCKQSLTYYEDSRSLICLHCGHHEPMRELCQSCGGSELIMRGIGLGGLVKEVKKLIGADREVIKIEKEGQDEPALKLGSVIVGTQYAWNLLDWQKIGLMSFVDADQSLFIPEYKIMEGLWQSIRDARFRLTPGANLCLQTSHPEHALFKSLAEPEGFYNSELSQRKMFGYPPYKFLVRFWYKNVSQKICAEAAAALYLRLGRLTKGNLDITISPNQPLFPYKYKGSYGQVIVAKISYQSYKSGLRFLNKNIPTTWKADPNPATLLSF